MELPSSANLRITSTQEQIAAENNEANANSHAQSSPQMGYTSEMYSVCNIPVGPDFRQEEGQQLTWAIQDFRTLSLLQPLVASRHEPPV
nr:hypothetical protein CFP56_24002 [Quercus suber]